MADESETTEPAGWQRLTVEWIDGARRDYEFASWEMAASATAIIMHFEERATLVPLDGVRQVTFGKPWTPVLRPSELYK